jgi:hypothetical protein
MLQESFSSESIKQVAAVTVVEPSSKKRYEGGTGTFAARGSLDLYEPISQYEGKHRYDPNASWTKAEEKKLVRKVRIWSRRV